MTITQPPRFAAATNKWAYAQAFTTTSLGRPRRAGEGLRLAKRLAALRPRRTADQLLPALSQPIPN